MGKNVDALKEMMTAEQWESAQLPTATEQTVGLAYQFPDSYKQTKAFALALNPLQQLSMIQPTVGLRRLRLALILEEFLELVEACGFRLLVNDDSECVDSVIENGARYVALQSDALAPMFTLQHVEGSRYDVVEAADAISDLNVVVNGAGIEFGIPVPKTDKEVYNSNFTKLVGTPLGPVVNHCSVCQPTPPQYQGQATPCECGTTEHWTKPDAPLNKVLKPKSFVPANIAAVLLQHAIQIDSLEEEME